MDLVTLQNLKIGEIISFHSGGSVFGTGNSMQEQFFTVTKIEDIKEPTLPEWEDTPKPGPAKKYYLQHYPSKKEFYLLVPKDYEKEKYVYFDNESQDIQDFIPITQLTLRKK